MNILLRINEGKEWGDGRTTGEWSIGENHCQIGRNPNGDGSEVKPLLLPIPRFLSLDGVAVTRLNLVSRPQTSRDWANNSFALYLPQPATGKNEEGREMIEGGRTFYCRPRSNNNTAAVIMLSTFSLYLLLFQHLHHLNWQICVCWQCVVIRNC